MMQTLKDRWHQFSSRERLILLAGSLVVGLSLLFLVVVDPLLAKLDQLDRQAVRKQKDIRDLAALSQEFVVKQARLKHAEERMPPLDSHFSLITFMEEAATTTHVRERITGMQPQVQTLPQGYQETAVDLRLEGVQLPELLALLVAIDQAPYGLQVRHLQIRPKFDNPVNLDATVRVLSYAKG
jgi:general secretion pathway protein M